MSNKYRLNMALVTINKLNAKIEDSDLFLNNNS